MWPRQAEILLAAQNNRRVTVATGQKCGKSTSACIIALWFFCAFPRARVILTGVTSRQVDDILWKELRRLHRNALIPIGGELHKVARSGLECGDRQILGFTAKDAEAAAGYSSPQLLYIIDEASGVADEFYAVAAGNMASAGSRMLMIGNPTKASGQFFRSHNDREALYTRIQISSTETPNCVEGRDVIPGLASLEWLQERKIEWGEDNPIYKVRVLGQFVLNEEGTIISLQAIQDAELRWFELEGIGRLQIGLDPAGPGLAGDETAIAIRRGDKIISLLAYRGKTAEAIVEEIAALAREHRRRDDIEIPLIVVDREGPIGIEVQGLLRTYAREHFGSFEVVGVRSSDRAHRRPQEYDRTRDELWWNLSQWIRQGGAIPTDTRLAKELHAPQWHQQINGTLKCTPKSDLRRPLDGRSPDRADACALAVWSAGTTVVTQPAPPAPTVNRASFEPHHTPRPAVDPYGALSAFDPRYRR